MTMVVDDARIRTAHHEAGHAVASVLYRHPLALVSIRPGETYHGIAAYEPAPPVEGFEPDYPVPMQRHETRARIERDIVITLAGPIAGSWVEPFESGYVDDRDQQAAARAADALSALTPRHRELLEALETDPIGRDPDEVRATELAEAWTGDREEGSRYLMWLWSVAQRLVREYWHVVRALAAELLRSDVLSGDDVASIVRSARRDSAA
jgi:hypothetical protein